MRLSKKDVDIVSEALALLQNVCEEQARELRATIDLPDVELDSQASRAFRERELEAERLETKAHRCVCLDSRLRN